MKTYKCEAMGDVVYIQADDLLSAKARFTEVMGDDVPESMLTWSEVESLPDGEEYL